MVYLCFTSHNPLIYSLNNVLFHNLNTTEINILLKLLIGRLNNWFSSMNLQKTSTLATGNMHGLQVMFIIINLKSTSFQNNGLSFLRTLLMALSHGKSFAVIHLHRWTYSILNSLLSSMYYLVVPLIQDHAPLLLWIEHLFIFLRYILSMIMTDNVEYSKSLLWSWRQARISSFLFSWFEPHWDSIGRAQSLNQKVLQFTDWICIISGFPRTWTDYS